MVFKKKHSKKMLMAVYNPIEFDGRVKRSSECLTNFFDLEVICLKAENRENNNSKYKISRVNQNIAFGRISKQFLFWFHLLIKAIKVKPHFLYAHDFFMAFPCLIAARIIGAKLIYDSHELIVPEEGVVFSFRSKLFYLLEKYSIKRSDLVIAANKERAEIMQRHYHLSTLPCYIRNFVDSSVNNLSNKEVLNLYPMLKKKQKTDIHVVYMGDINFDRGLGLFMDIDKFLPENYIFLFVGNGPDKNILKRKADINNSFRIIGQVNHEHVQDVIRQADIGIVTYPSAGLNNVFCSSNKVYEYAHAGLPMISTCQPPLEKMFIKYKLGKLIGCAGIPSPEKTAQTIIELASDLKLYQQKLIPFLTDHSWESESARLLSAVMKLA
jgi:hypothetical protein